MCYRTCHTARPLRISFLAGSTVFNVIGSFHNTVFFNVILLKFLNKIALEFSVRLLSINLEFLSSS